MIRMQAYQQEGVVVEDLNNPSPSELMSWLDYCPNFINNYQSKNFLFNAPLFVDPAEVLDVPNNIFFFKEPKFLNMEIEPEKVLDRAKRVDIQLRDTQLTSENMMLVKEDIFADFGIKESERKHPMAEEKWHNITDGSKKLYESLSQSEIDNIYERNRLDAEIYFTDSLFWKGGK